VLVLDRWGRSVAHCVRSIQELVSLGIRFLSPNESIDTGTGSPMSKFLLHLFAAFAEMERGIIRERVCAGVRAAKAKGTRLGRPKRVFRRGEALRLRGEGKSWRNVAETLFVRRTCTGPTHSSVRFRILPASLRTSPVRSLKKRTASSKCRRPHAIGTIELIRTGRRSSSSPRSETRWYLGRSAEP
jgi:hypothetical protein